MHNKNSQTYHIDSIDQLEALYGSPKANAIKKETTELTPAYWQWIENARFFALASSGYNGLDCSPRGDAQYNTLKIVDNKTLLIPDRKGNNRLDTLRNIIENPNVAMLFLIPQVNEAMRINGTAQISTDPAWLAHFETANNKPISCICITIQAVYFQCARAILRSELWTSTELNQVDIPSAGQMIKAVDPDFNDQAYDEQLCQSLSKPTF